VYSTAITGFDLDPEGEVTARAGLGHGAHHLVDELAHHDAVFAQNDAVGLELHEEPDGRRSGRSGSAVVG
jgi:hypothetical protein